MHQAPAEVFSFGISHIGNENSGWEMLCHSLVRSRMICLIYIKIYKNLFVFVCVCIPQLEFQLLYTLEPL